MTNSRDSRRGDPDPPQQPRSLSPSWAAARGEGWTVDSSLLGARMWLLLLLIAVAPFVVTIPWQAQHGPPVGADDYGQYLSHARALVEARAYTDIGYVRTR